MTNRLAYQQLQPSSRPRPLRTLARLALLAMLAIAVLYLLLLHIEPGAPFRLGGRPSPQEAWVENLLTAQDSAMLQAAGDGNLELHFAGSPEDRNRQAIRLTAIYFNWNYLRYPKRVIVGKDNAIINNGGQLFAADVVPDDTWLRAHDIASVLTLLPGPDGTLSSVSRRIR